MEQEWPRRRFMRSAAAIAGAVVVGPSVVAACGDDENAASTTTAGAGGSATTSAGSGGTGSGGTQAEPNVFRLSSRHVGKPCRACVEHARNRYYQTAEDAEADRAHEGCNCKVRGQKVPDSDVTSYFTGGRTVWDKRNG